MDPVKAGIKCVEELYICHIFRMFREIREMSLKQIIMKMHVKLARRRE